MSNSTAQGRFRIVDGGFSLDGEPFRFVGVNLRELAYYGYSPWDNSKHAKEKYIDVQLDKANEMRAQVVRLYGAYHVNADGEAASDTDEAVKRLKKILDKCQERDMFALVTLDDAKDSGFFVGCDEDTYRPFPQGIDGPRQYYGMDYYENGYKETFIPFLKAVVSKLKGHPALFAWGICNEAQVYPHSLYADKMAAVSQTFLDYFRATSTLLRELDPYTLITTSIEATHHVFVEHAYERKKFSDKLYKLPTIDFATMHTYRDKQRMDVSLGHNDGYIPIEAKHAKTVWKKPIIMEEIGPTGGKNRPNGGNWLEGTLRELFDLGFSGVMQWAFSAAKSNIAVGDDDAGMHLGGSEVLPTGDWGKMFEVYQFWGSQFWHENAGDWDGELPEIRGTSLTIDISEVSDEESEAPEREKTMLMEVVKRVRVRKEPRVAEETMIEWLEPGTQIEVKADVVQEADNYVWRQHTDTGNWSAVNHVDGTLYLLEVIAPYVAVPPETTAPETVTMKMVGAANIRDNPTTSANDVGDLSPGDEVEVFPGERSISDNYVWVRLSDNRYSVQVKISSGTVYMERVPQEGVTDAGDGGSTDTGAGGAVVVEAPTTLLMDVVQQVEGRSEALISPDNVVETLEQGDQVQVLADVSESVDGFTWRKGAENDLWYTEQAVDGELFLLEVIVPDEAASSDEPAPETATMKVMTSLNIRSEPSGTATDIGDLKAGQLVNAYPNERFLGPKYAWLRIGDNQWSAQVRYSDGDAYMERVPQSVLTELLESGVAEAGEYGVGFHSLFQQLPVSLANTKWFYYFGNTTIAYRCREIYGYGYSRGLHAGLDFGNRESVPVVAGVEGVVTLIETAKTANHRVWVKTRDNIVIYQHVWNEKVSVNQTVGPDTIVAEIRPTGDGGLNHLHLEVRDAGNSKILNPLMMMPTSMSEQLMNLHPPSGASGFLTKLGRYLEPFDQPIIPLSRDNYDKANWEVPIDFLNGAELSALLPKNC